MKRILLFLLTLLGFGSTGCEHFIAAAEYGTPHVSFNLKARVVDENGNPIQGIEVTTKDGYGFDDRTGVSDYLGNIDAHGSYIWPGEQYAVVFHDIDGEYNGGEFEDLSLDIGDKVTQIEEGSGSWYKGSYVADLGDVTMTLKEKEEQEEQKEQE